MLTLKMPKSKLGLVHVYTGDGKGKTTAALGVAFRAAGHGFSVLIIQFLKGGSHTGEISAVKKFPNMKIRQFGRKCPYSDKMRKGLIDCGNCRDCFKTGRDEITKAQKALRFAREASKSGNYDIVVLDEVNVALAIGWIKARDVLNLVKKKHKNTELILTGRTVPKSIIKAADMVTEMKEVKHPMKRGIFVRRGIEY